MSGRRNIAEGNASRYSNPIGRFNLAAGDQDTKSPRDAATVCTESLMLSILEFWNYFGNFAPFFP
jgi:hypothetical protein